MTTPQAGHIAEIVTFKLAASVTAEDFVALSMASEEYIRSHPGFLHRQLSQGEDGRWTDYAVWQDMETAKTVADGFMQQSFAPALIAAIEPGSAAMRHEAVHWDMTA